MVAAKITPKCNMLTYGQWIAHIQKVTQADWVILPEAGALLDGPVELPTGAPETITRPTLTIDEAVDGYTAAETSLAYDGATANTRNATGYYARHATSGEIIYVYTDTGYAGASGVLQVRRGALGTTPAVMANNDVLYILSSFILGAATTGPVTLKYTPLPQDPGINLFG
jgi:hypothetical protein